MRHAAWRGRSGVVDPDFPSQTVTRVSGTSLCSRPNYAISQRRPGIYLCLFYSVFSFVNNVSRIFLIITCRNNFYSL